MANPGPGGHLQALTDEYNSLQTELSNSVAARQKLESQQQENKAVQKEFATLDDEAGIYKLVGPVLLKQDKTEAVLAVEGRLSFINREIERIEKEIEEVRQKSEKLKMEIYQLQSQLEASQGVPAAA
ncbi:Prefoldin beta-like protein [Microthyrium microscopicum]|uniref:Prefoldin beta-like protein n=1 Tax=Microthyrium microscopicum TaxID=703497 RepID=A0A6A6U3X2_9PEZI|nr:Prefoldin beta-like protein [Microthyrium microscopicum]